MRVCVNNSDESGYLNREDGTKDLILKTVFYDYNKTYHNNQLEYNKENKESLEKIYRKVHELQKNIINKAI